MTHRIYKFALLLVLIGAGGILCVQLDPLIGIAQILLTVGAVLLREVGSGR